MPYIVLHLQSLQAEYVLPSMNFRGFCPRVVKVVPVSHTNLLVESGAVDRFFWVKG
jgi:hypothetical protein